MLDSADRYGRADPGVPSSVVALAALTQELRRIWPDHVLVVSECVAGTAAEAVPGGRATSPAPGSAAPGGRPLPIVRAPYFTDAMRLRDVVPPRVQHLVIARPAALLLAADTLRAVLGIARARCLDVATLAGVPTDVFHVLSADALAVVGELGPVPRCVTVADAVLRLRSAGGARTDAALTACELTASDVAGHDERLARALPPAAWKAVPGGDVLALPPSARLAETVRRVRHATDTARDATRRWRDTPVVAGGGEHRPVLVAVPSMYQSGAHAAWAEVSAWLSPGDVAFVVGRGTALQASLVSRGFTVFEARESLAASSVADTPAWLDAMARVTPRVVHFDGSEGNAWAPLAFMRGARVVQHVRLNDPDRYRPAYGYADAVVVVSEHLRHEVVARVGETVRVEHIPDGVFLDARPTARRSGGHDLLCLCVGRIEPEKGQLRVLDIVGALQRHHRCRLVLLGSCGSDPAYCDEVTRRIRSGVDGVPTTWRSFEHPIGHWYARADVVLVGSRNEALGMVGMEALAAGCLLVAQRSTGYASIIDEARGEGLLFEAGEPAAAVAARIRSALEDAAGYAIRARRKAEAAFDARWTADRIATLWRQL